MAYKGSALYITLLGTVNCMYTLYIYVLSRIHYSQPLHSVMQIVANCMGSKLYYGLWLQADNHPTRKPILLRFGASAIFLDFSFVC